MDIIRRIKSEGKSFATMDGIFNSLLVKLIKVNNDFLWIRTEEQNDDVYPEIASRKFEIVEFNNEPRYTFPFREGDLDVDDRDIRKNGL